MLSTTPSTSASELMLKFCLYSWTPFVAPVKEPLEPVCQSEVDVASAYQLAGTVPIL